MCKSKMNTDVIKSVHTPKSSRTTAESVFRRSRRSSSSTNPSSTDFSTANYTTTTTTTTGLSNNKDSWKSSISSRTSLSSLKDCLPESPHIYDFSEIRAATNNFLSKPFSSSPSSSSWRCNLRNKEVIIFQRKLRRSIEPTDLQNRLSLICRSHHSSLIKLRGVSVSGNYIYLVHDYVHGANLSNTLRNPKNLSFTILSSWLSRMQVATDLAHGLDYVHQSMGLNSGFVHNRIKSTSIIVVTEPGLNAKICHFGTAELCGEVTAADEGEIAKKLKDSKGLRRADSRAMKFEGTRGYMAPEFQNLGMATKKTDIFAFGVVVLELLSGEEAFRYCIDEEIGGYRRVSVIETAREAVENGGGGGGVVDGGVRKWVDKRLKDSYPVEVAEKMMRLGLECVEEDPEKRPDMDRIAGRISKLFLESRNWADRDWRPYRLFYFHGPSVAFLERLMILEYPQWSN